MGEPIRILIAEDLATDVELAQREIRKTLPACVFAQVETHETFLTALESFQPDLIVSDYNMPRFDGMTALKLALERVPLTPLIIWTGTLNEDVAVECMKAGASNYVIKEHIKRLGPAVVHALEEKQVRLERRRAENALRESEEMYRSLVNTSPSAVTVVDLQGNVLMVNQQTLEVYGYASDSELLGRNIFDWVLPEEKECAKYHFGQLLTEPILRNMEFRLPRRSGEIIFAEVNAALVNNPAGQPQSVIILTTNITDRKLAEESLRESEARYRARTKELEALFALSTHLREAKTADDILPVVLCEMSRVFENDGCEIALPDATGEHLTIALAEGRITSEIGNTFGWDEGVVGFVMRTCEPYVTDEYATDPHRMDSLAHTPLVGPAVVAPLYSENEVLGALVVTRRRDPSTKLFSPEAVRLLTAMGEMAGNALRRARLFDDVQRHLRRTQALHDIQLAVASSFELQITLDVALEHAIAQLGVDAAAVLLFNANTLTLEYTATRGFSTRRIEHRRLRIGEGYAGRAAVEQRMLHIPNLLETANEFGQVSPIREERFVTYYGMPLITKGQVKGVLEVFHRTPLRPDKDWQAFLETLAGQIAIAIDNLTLFTNLEKSNLQLMLAYDATIDSLSRALDLRDRETEGHTQRVVDLTIRLARAMGMPDTELVHVRRGALIHDMGKMGIPDAVLLKPDKLTGEEWEIMRLHPQYAFEMFSPIEYLRPALDIPYCHHEKWDGTGYPRGLEGKAIPLAARLFAIVDVWDALTSERPYRPAWSKGQALTYIQQQAGKHFDPHVVETFRAILQEEVE
jgi:PAS domain S-box-containing protein